MNKKLTGMYAVLFLMALLVVARILPYIFCLRRWLCLCFYQIEKYWGRWITA